MSLKSEKIRQYVIENGLDLTTIPNKLVRQIAQILDVNPNTVKSTLQRLRSQRSTYEDPPPATQTVIQHEAPPTTTPQPPQLHYGQFIIRKNQDGTADIICPTCGTYEPDYPLPTIEKPVEVTKEVEYIPPEYVKATCGQLTDILNLTHPDGKPIWQCPECAKPLLQWYNQHKQELEQAAGIKRKDDNTLAAIGLILAPILAPKIIPILNQLLHPNTNTPITTQQPNYYMPTQTQSILQQLKEQGLLP